jgi:type II secretory pathway component HofQ
VIVAPDRDAMRFLLDIYAKDTKQPYRVKPKEDGSYMLVADHLDVNRMLYVRTNVKSSVNAPRVARSKITEWLAAHPITVQPLGDTVEVNLEQQPFEQVIFMLASSRNQEYTVSVGVVGNVSLRLNNHPWAMAFRHAMLQVDAYSVEVEGATHYMNAGMNRTLSGKALKAEPASAH